MISRNELGVGPTESRFEPGVISERLQLYLPRPIDLTEALKAIQVEIEENGALQIGVFGSRTRPNFHSESDLDLAVLSPRAGSKRLAYAERKGRYKFLNVGMGQWIDIQRYNPKERERDMEDLVKRSILQSTTWIWSVNG